MKKQTTIRNKIGIEARATSRQILGSGVVVRKNLRHSSGASDDAGIQAGVRVSLLDA